MDLNKCVACFCESVSKRHFFCTQKLKPCDHAWAESLFPAKSTHLVARTALQILMQICNTAENSGGMKNWLEIAGVRFSDTNMKTRSSVSRPRILLTGDDFASKNLNGCMRWIVRKKGKISTSNASMNHSEGDAQSDGSQRNVCLAMFYGMFGCNSWAILPNVAIRRMPSLLRMVIAFVQRHSGCIHLTYCHPLGLIHSDLSLCLVGGDASPADTLCCYVTHSQLFVHMLSKKWHAWPSVQWRTSSSCRPCKPQNVFRNALWRRNFSDSPSQFRSFSVGDRNIWQVYLIKLGT